MREKEKKMEDFFFLFFCQRKVMDKVFFLGQVLLFLSTSNEDNWQDNGKKMGRLKILI